MVIRQIRQRFTPYGIMKGHAYNAPINVMPHYPPPGQCWGIGGDLNLAKFKSTTHWARQSVKSQPSPHSIIEEKMGNLIVGAFNCSTCIW